MNNPESKGRHASLSELKTIITSEMAIWRPHEWGDMRVGYETYLSDFDDAKLSLVIAEP